MLQAAANLKTSANTATSTGLSTSHNVQNPTSNPTTTDDTSPDNHSNTNINTNSQTKSDDKNNLNSDIKNSAKSDDKNSLKNETKSKVKHTASEAGVVIIGAGMAGSRLAIELANAWQADNATNKRPITLISKEPQVGYNRIMLSPVLGAEVAFDETYLYPQADYERLGIHVIAGVAVTDIDTQLQQITLANSHTLPYHQLVFATGSNARVIPLPNHDAKGVHVFRDVADVMALSAYARQHKVGLVIGGGVLGLEAACALAKQGAQMQVIHAADYVLNRQLDAAAAALLQAELTRRGVGLQVDANSKQIQVNAKGEVIGLTLQDGRYIAADFIVMAVGVMPNIALANACGITVGRGIIVDEYMHTSCHNVYAVGECIELNERLFGMVAPVNQQVDTLVTVLSQPKTNWQPYVDKPLSLKLKVSGISAFSAGKIVFSDIVDAASDKGNDDDDEYKEIETIVYRQPDQNHYQCLYIQHNILVGAVLYGAVAEGSFYSQLINAQTDITAIKDTLIFGEDYCDMQAVVAKNSSMHSKQTNTPSTASNKPPTKPSNKQKELVAI